MGRYRIIILLFWKLLCQLHMVDGTVKYVNTTCDNLHGFYTKSSVYNQNLNHLLSDMSAQSSVVLFRNITTGETPDKVYGLYQCRQDLSVETCTECIKEAAQTISQKCELSHEAVTWYYECTLRYANRPFFSVSEQNEAAHFWVPFNTSTQFSEVLSSSLDGVIREAASGSKFGHFSTRETDVSGQQKLYCLAQCTSDLDAFECNSCLQAALGVLNTKCAKGCIRAFTFLTSCHLRYDISLFYNETNKVVLAPPPTDSDKKLKTPIIIGVAVGSSVCLLLLAGGLYLCISRVPANIPKQTNDDGLGKAEVVQYDFETLKTATEDFDSENKLGGIGFGSVYKGTLGSGEKVAIKRLSKYSGQIANEFMAEAKIIARLQHINLVKLVGFCSELDEKLLVYEFVPNKSLDWHIFAQQTILDWGTRHKIIIGIARGLQYLHEDSRITIIHRDMKASNILLDKDMNPKIINFGLAKLFGDKQGHGNTSRIFGTHGYMAPEYMLRGEYSTKTDVYSFGIIVLEIVCGRKNRAPFSETPEKDDLPTYAWNLWMVGNSLEMMDQTLESNCSRSEVMRCIQIGMLCVQGNAENRPTMTEVVLMLTGSNSLPVPLSHTLPSDFGTSETYSYIETDESVNEYSQATEIEQDLYPRSLSLSERL